MSAIVCYYAPCCLNNAIAARNKHNVIEFLLIPMNFYCDIYGTRDVSSHTYLEDNMCQSLTEGIHSGNTHGEEFFSRLDRGSQKMRKRTIRAVRRKPTSVLAPDMHIWGES